MLRARPFNHLDGKTNDCVEYIKDYFDGLGIDNKIYQRDEGKPKIVVRVKGSSGRKTLWGVTTTSYPGGCLTRARRSCR